jgi:hypothetical protein
MRNAGEVSRGKVLNNINAHEKEAVRSEQG